jgi:sortase (surface protein transpeptidase)
MTSGRGRVAAHRGRDRPAVRRVRGRPLARLAGLAAALALVAGCSAASAERAGGPATPAEAPVTTAGGPVTTAGGLDAARGFRSTRGYRATPVPVRLEIPSIGVGTRLQRLGRAQDGTIEVPKGPREWEEAGWYQGGTRPGDPGSAVILGHVDSRRSGPAVFFRLRELRRGDQIKVVRADGSSVRFAVDRTEQYPKSRFPTDAVYYPTLSPELRLVTCGGSFDATAGHYRSNVIVFATLRS